MREVNEIGRRVVDCRRGNRETGRGWGLRERGSGDREIFEVGYQSFLAKR